MPSSHALSRFLTRLRRKGAAIVDSGEDSTSSAATESTSSRQIRFRTLRLRIRKAKTTYQEASTCTSRCVSPSPQESSSAGRAELPSRAVSTDLEEEDVEPVRCETLPGALPCICASEHTPTTESDADPDVADARHNNCETDDTTYIDSDNDITGTSSPTMNVAVVSEQPSKPVLAPTQTNLLTPMSLQNVLNPSPRHPRASSVTSDVFGLGRQLVGNSEENGKSEHDSILFTTEDDEPLRSVPVSASPSCFFRGADARLERSRSKDTVSSYGNPLPERDALVQGPTATPIAHRPPIPEHPPGLPIPPAILQAQQAGPISMSAAADDATGADSPNTTPASPPSAVEPELAMLLAQLWAVDKHALPDGAQESIQSKARALGIAQQLHWAAYGMRLRDDQEAFSTLVRIVEAHQRHDAGATAPRDAANSLLQQGGVAQGGYGAVDGGNEAEEKGDVAMGSPEDYTDDEGSDGGDSVPSLRDYYDADGLRTGHDDAQELEAAAAVAAYQGQMANDAAYGRHGVEEGPRPEFVDVGAAGAPHHQQDHGRQYAQEAPAPAPAAQPQALDPRYAAMAQRFISGMQLSVDGERYTIVARRGAGAQGCIFAALTAADEPVAIKILQLAHAAPAERAMLEREHAVLRAVAESGSPFMVPLLHSWADQDYVYFVMPLYRANMYQSLAWGDFPFVDYAVQLICALERLHALGYAHLDLKPENILLAPAGHAALADFGLARCWTRMSTTTRSVATRGTGRRCASCGRVRRSCMTSLRRCSCATPRSAARCKR